ISRKIRGGRWPFAVNGKRRMQTSKVQAEREGSQKRRQEEKEARAIQSEGRNRAKVRSVARPVPLTLPGLNDNVLGTPSYRYFNLFSGDGQPRACARKEVSMSVSRLHGIGLHGDGARKGDSALLLSLEVREPVVLAFLRRYEEAERSSKVL